jgi:Protein of unknown function (DUF3311)
MPGPSGSTGSNKAGIPARRGVHVRPANFLLLIPLIGTLVPMFYNQDHPRLGGMPFFYWYQLLWIPISVAITWFVYKTTGGERS